eukprot:TRINITY_DN2854_c0_g1_i1.p1 TRINITY_DN2854_c0_g1~~TRINITY_DN2854_c0_g1_i1.p1  ORF type:complete len:796 (-),score=253.70 TRINITY_DN2854_c0_g1_i1:83-2470(-)
MGASGSTQLQDTFVACVKALKERDLTQPQEAPVVAPEDGAAAQAPAPVAPSAEAMWKGFWEYLASVCPAGSAPDALSGLLLAKDVREIKASHPLNIAVVLNQCADMLHAAVVQGETDPQALSRVPAVLCTAERLTSILYEEDDGFVNTYIWSAQHLAPEATEVVVGKRLLQTVLDLMFLPNFTVPNTVHKKAAVSDGAAIPVTYAWASGVGIQSAGGVEGGWAYASTAMLENRIAVLQCLLVLTSAHLYNEPGKLSEVPNQALEFICATPPLPHTQVLFYSLLNTVATWDPVGWGMPYNHLVSSVLPEKLVQISSHMLLALLLYTVHTPAAAPTEQPAAAADKLTKALTVPLSSSNLFTQALGSLSAVEHFKRLFSGLHALLAAPLAAAGGTYLPWSARTPECFMEACMLLWLALYVNGAFRTHVLHSEDVTGLVMPIAFFIDQSVVDYQYHGMAQLGLMILLLLSEDRQFGVELNKPFPHPKFLGLYLQEPAITADFFVNFFLKHLLKVDNTTRKREVKRGPLLDSFLTLLANVAPYVKSMTMQSANGLVTLFDLVSMPRFLRATQRNFLYAAKLLRAFNASLQYQYSGNAALSYVVLCHLQSFRRLHSLQYAQLVPQPPAELLVADLPPLPGLAPSPATSPSTSPAEQPKEQPKPAEQLEQKEQPQPEQKEQKPAEASAAPAADSWQPTMEWFDQMKASLPLSVIMALGNAMAPQLERLVTGSVDDAEAVQHYLADSTLVGLLPEREPLVTIVSAVSDRTLQWLVQTLWGIIFVSQRGAFAPAKVRLFMIRSK